MCSLCILTQADDYTDHRYHVKRAAYLSFIAALLKKKKTFKNMKFATASVRSFACIAQNVVVKLVVFASIMRDLTCMYSQSLSSVFLRLVLAV
jgi:hypothetical protein